MKEMKKKMAFYYDNIDQFQARPAIMPVQNASDIISGENTASTSI